MTGAGCAILPLEPPVREPRGPVDGVMAATHTGAHPDPRALGYSRLLVMMQREGRDVGKNRFYRCTPRRGWR